jgi:hypothetical protein
MGCCGVVNASVGAPCSDHGGVVCDGNGTCTSSHCSDGVKDADETDVDCGGATCAPCVDGKMCLANHDCVDGVCNASHVCAAPSCMDAVQNGTETDVDCGGNTCPVCPTGDKCKVDGDCVSSGCDALSLTCVASECSDHRLDGTETDVDCGGPSCPACATGLKCAADSDCTTAACDALALTCDASQCADHRKDGKETDADCGGGSCPACATGMGCLADSDCTTMACDARTFQCVDSQCADGRRDGNETDVDCGGGSCSACAVGKGCAADSDCTSMACDLLMGQCVSTTCSDQRKDGTETDVDCGGICPACPTGQKCAQDTDCASNACDATSLLCVASQCTDHRKDGLETDVDCGGGTCSACATGKQCTQGPDCASNACDAVSLLCVTNQCVDHRKDGNETDVDCGGGTCPTCATNKKCAQDTDCTSNACDTVTLACVASQCSDHRKDGLETDVDCGGGICPKCSTGTNCTQDSDCLSNACDAVALLCVPSQCADHRADGSESDVDCGGGVCAACAVGKHCNVNLDCQAGLVCSPASHLCQ